MISKLKVENFKCLQNHEIQFKPLTILAGGNGVGKSTAIQALLLLRRAAELGSSGLTHVELNDHDYVQLGRASTVLSNQNTSKNIGFICSDEYGKYASYRFDFDDDRSPLSLHIIEDHQDEMNFAQYSFRYLNAERIGPRRAYDMSSTDSLNLGTKGQYSAFAIYQADMMNRTVHEDLLTEKEARGKFSAQVEAWMQFIIPGFRLEIKPFPDLNNVMIKYQNISDTDYYIPTATGFGITYVLPIIVAGLLASIEQSPLLIVENPEAHLHPLGQSRIGQYLALVARCGVQVMVETHSEHVIDGARLKLASISEFDKLLINFFYQDEGSIGIKSINTNQVGELLSWPKGFLDQKQQDLKELLRLK